MKLIFVVMVAMLVCAALPARARYDVTDRIREIDLKSHEVRLRNGQYYEFLPETDLTKLKVGDTVTIRVHAYDDSITVMNYADNIAIIHSEH